MGAAHTFPDGWRFVRESATAGELQWPLAGPKGKPRTAVAHLDIEIRYSPFGWMWGVDAAHSQGGFCYAALENWRNLASCPAAAAATAASEVIERTERDCHTGANWRSVRAAAQNLIATLAAAPAVDLVERVAPKPWPLAQQPGRPAGYYRVATVPKYLDLNEVVWWTGSCWLKLRPGCADDINRDRTEQLASWPGTAVWPLSPHIAPELSRQFDAWAGLHVDQPAVLQHLPMPALRAAGGQLDLFA